MRGLGRRAPVSTALLLLLLSAYPSDAHAYIDPGTGSMLLQVLIAAAAGAILIVKNKWRRLRSWFFRKPAQPEPSADVTEDAER